MIQGQYVCSHRPLGKIDASIGTMLTKRSKRWPDHPVMAYRAEDDTYRHVTWSEFYENMASLAAYLYSRGIRKGDRLAVFSRNSYQMLVWEMAVTSMGAITVPIFAGYDVDNAGYILKHAEPKALFVDDETRLEKVKQTGTLSSIPLIMTLQDLGYERITDHFEGGNLGDFANMIAAVNPGDVCFIQYTSGTTGNPKGVMLTHRNIMSQRKGMSQVWDIPYKSRFLSYLPWHHSFGGLFERFAGLYHGATIYLEDSFGKDLKRLLHNWTEAKPTHFFSVPKIYIALVTEAKASREIHDTIFHPGLKFVFTAAAPLPKDCGEYFKTQKVPVVEGWGLTETSPLITFTTLGEERTTETVGTPIAGCEILLTEDDEILTRGPNIMKGYYKDKERTDKIIDHMGWLHTGDLGELVDDGLKIVCRVDNLFKLSNGEKVSSMLVENAMTIKSQWVQHALAVGAGKDFVGALVFLNHPNLKRWSEKTGKDLTSGWEIAQDKDLQKLVASEITENMTDFQPKYMRVKSFVIIPKDLTIEAGDLTPTMKVKRHIILDKYQEWWEALYNPAENPDKKPYIVNLQ